MGLIGWNQSYTPTHLREGRHPPRTPAQDADDEDDDQATPVGAAAAAAVTPVTPQTPPRTTSWTYRAPLSVSPFYRRAPAEAAAAAARPAGRARGGMVGHDEETAEAVTRDVHATPPHLRRREEMNALTSNGQVYEFQTYEEFTGFVRDNVMSGTELSEAGFSMMTPAAILSLVRIDDDTESSPIPIWGYARSETFRDANPGADQEIRQARATGQQFFYRITTVMQARRETMRVSDTLRTVSRYGGGYGDGGGAGSSSGSGTVAFSV